MLGLKALTGLIFHVLVQCISFFVKFCTAASLPRHQIDLAIGGLINSVCIHRVLLPAFHIQGALQAELISAGYFELPDFSIADSADRIVVHFEIHAIPF